jgi:hypothetical protein
VNCRRLGWRGPGARSGGLLRVLAVWLGSIGCCTLLLAVGLRGFASGRPNGAAFCLWVVVREVSVMRVAQWAI